MSALRESQADVDESRVQFHFRQPIPIPVRWCLYQPHIAYLAVVSFRYRCRSSGFRTDRSSLTRVV